MTATWPAAQRVAAILESMRGFTQTIRHPVLSALADDASACNFLAGNPQQPAPARYVETLQRWTVPADKNWYGYKRPDRTAQQAAAAGLSAELGIDFEADDIVLTRGAHGAVAAALAAVVDYGDEVIFVSPPWFFYEAMILGAGGTPVRVRMNEETFDLDLDALAHALSPRTRAVVINTPHNPTGRVYPPSTLQQLAQLLTSASERHAREIYLVSDEAYSRVLFSGTPFTSPGRFYPRTFLLHTYSKTTLAPGQRIGFLAMPPRMPAREQLRQAFMAVGFALGGPPDAIMQYALPDLDEGMLIDLADLETKRDRMVDALQAFGYQLHVPEATFYLLPRCPIDDDLAFTLKLAQRGVLVLPGHALEMPGYFRVSLTATSDMIERALPVFQDAMADAN